MLIEHTCIISFRDKISILPLTYYKYMMGYTTKTIEDQKDRDMRKKNAEGIKKDQEEIEKLKEKVKQFNEENKVPPESPLRKSFLK